MSSKILIPEPIDKIGTDYLLERGYELICPNAYTHEDMIRNVAECEAIILRKAVVDKDVLNAAKNLKIVARHGAGYENVDTKSAQDLGIWVTNTPMATTLSVAEFTISLILMLAKKIPLCSSALQNGNFDIRKTNMGMDLNGKTLAVIGLGRIGREVAKKAIAGFDMNVIAYDPLCTPENAMDGVKLVSDLNLALNEADFVTLHMPSTEKTNGMFGEEQFKQMKKTAHLINCARGEILKEDELVKALEQGEIAGAALDVFASEPPEKDNPLLNMPQVIVTPHIASNTSECMNKIALHCAMEVHLVLSGQKPKWPVNAPKL